MTIRGGGNPNTAMAAMPLGEWTRRLGASPAKRMTASWSRPYVGSTEYKRGSRDCSRPMAGSCPWRIRKLRCDRHLEQTAAMVPPRVMVKGGMGGRRLAKSFSRSAAAERLVNAIFIVIISELFQLSLQVNCVPD
jgi:hypothetical protein